jgi:hypothetical protein
MRMFHLGPCGPLPAMAAISVAPAAASGGRAGQSPAAAGSPAMHCGAGRNVDESGRARSDNADSVTCGRRSVDLRTGVRPTAAQRGGEVRGDQPKAQLS